MGLTWLLATDRAAYMPVVTQVLRAFMAGSHGLDATSELHSCSITGGDMPYAVDSAELGEWSSSLTIHRPFSSCRRHHILVVLLVFFIQFLFWNAHRDVCFWVFTFPSAFCVYTVWNGGWSSEVFCFLTFASFLYRSCAAIRREDKVKNSLDSRSSSINVELRFLVYVLLEAMPVYGSSSFPILDFIENQICLWYMRSVSSSYLANELEQT